MNTKAIVLFGHGARDVRWREPFDRLACLWRAWYPNTSVELAFFGSHTAKLRGGFQSSFGGSKEVVAPIFFGQDGHLPDDLPVLLKNACQENFQR